MTEKTKNTGRRRRRKRTRKRHSPSICWCKVYYRYHTWVPSIPLTPSTGQEQAHAPQSRHGFVVPSLPPTVHAKVHVQGSAPTYVRDSRASLLQTDTHRAHGYETNQFAPDERAAAATSPEPHQNQAPTAVRPAPSNPGMRQVRTKRTPRNKQLRF